MPAFALGETVTVHGQPATVKYCGATSFADGEWVGVAFGTRTGKNDGTVKGVRYFTCEPGHGLFVHPSGVRRSGGVSLPACAWPSLEKFVLIERFFTFGLNPGPRPSVELLAALLERNPLRS